ncbi:MAG: asparaginase [Rhodospirillales bacterium]|nr:asparaginase [Rhodospirillales bacterium]MDP6804608.1 asparaginase [Rhodospirillales bacterium]
MNLRGPIEEAPAIARVDLGRRTRAEIVVEVTRGDALESRHRVFAAVADASGDTLARWGEVGRTIFPRSAIKALQALPIVETGAADAFAVTDEELALACASHRGEPAHTERVIAWLGRVGLAVGDLECGAHAPLDALAAAALARSGSRPAAVHNNCSGKHTGMLTHARHMGEDVAGYTQVDHPAQMRVRATLEEMYGEALSHHGIDGCSIPTYAAPLEAIARGMARLADAGRLADTRARASTRIRKAWAAHPRLISGTGSFNTRILELLAPRALAKAGAEGVYCALVAESGLGIALKADDGAARAAEAALVAVLRECGAIDKTLWERCADLACPVVRNWNDDPVGEVRTVHGD